MWVLGISPGPLQEQAMLLVSESSLQALNEYLTEVKMNNIEL